MELLTPKRRNRPELLDLPEEQTDAAEFGKGLDDIALTNRLLGGAKAVTKHLPCMAVGRPGRPVAILDIATGSADIPVEIARWARRAGVPAGITALDINPRVIEAARKRADGINGIDLLVADGLNTPFRDKTFDLTICALTAHHFTEGETARLLARMKRLTRGGVIVSDLRRSFISYALFFLLTRLFLRNRFTCHDGPLSILRAYTPDELLAIARSAGLSGARVVKHGFWRMTLIYETGNNG